MLLWPGPTVRSRGLHHPSQWCPSPSSLCSHEFVPKTVPTSITSLLDLSLQPCPHSQLHVPGHMYTYPACNHKHLPSGSTPTQQARGQGFQTPPPINPLILPPNTQKGPPTLIREQERSSSLWSGKLRLVQAPHLLCTPRLAMATSSGASSLWSPQRLPLLQATVPRLRAQPSPDLSHQLHPQLGWALGQGGAGSSGVGGSEWLL